MSDKNPLTRNLSLTERQLHIVREALELYDRLLMGQIDNNLWRLYIFHNRDIDHDAFAEICRRLKQLVFPELADNAYYGVGWEEDDARQQLSQIAYEIEAMIRHLEWRANPDSPKYSTSASPPLHYSTESLIELVKKD